MIESNIRMGHLYKPIHEYIEKVDLDKFNILIDEPLEIRNFVTNYTTYASDIDLFKVNEWWNSPDSTLYLQQEDCDGLNLLAVSLLYTLNIPCYFAIGGYNSDKINHAYGIYRGDTNYLIECTGNDIILELPKMKDKQEYHTVYVSDPFTQKTYKIEDQNEMY